MRKHRTNKKIEPLRYKLNRIMLALLGPVIYLIIAVFPWLNSEITLPNISGLFHFSGLPNLSTIKLPKIKLPSFSNKHKMAQVGPLSLEFTRLAQGDATITLDSFSLHWDKERPLLLIKADGSKQEALPSSHQVLENGISLDFADNLTLFFYPQKGLEIELAWLGEQDLPKVIRLPWNQTVQGNAQDLKTRFTADIELTDAQYLEIPLHYYAFAEHKTVLENARIISLLSQDKANPYQRLHADYRSRLFSELQENEPQTEQAAALYLELILGGQEALYQEASYQEAYEKIRLLAQKNAWDSIYLAPYLGINQNTLEEYIRTENQRIEQIRAQHLSSSWSFVGQQDTASLIFNNGDLNLLLSLTQRAVGQQAGDEERFYLNYFLWNLSKLYPRNPYIQPTTARSTFLAQLQSLSEAWQQDLPTGLSVRFALDVLKAEWDFPELQAQQLAVKLFELMDKNGELPQFYNQSPEENRIPFYESWAALTEPSLAALHPHDSTVVPGFWIWTSGSPQVFFESGQPIVITANNFKQANKLLLLRGVYFYPQELTIDGQTIQPAGQMPTPELGREATWFYNPANRYLAITVAANEQSTSEIIIR